MKPAFLFAVLILFSACSKNEDSVFFDDCSCEKLQFEKGIVATDSLNHYSAMYPSSSWGPIRNLDEFHNGITGWDSASKTLEVAAITETKKGDEFVTAEEEMKSSPFDQIIDEGKINYHGAMRDWRLIKHDDSQLPYYSLYLTIDEKDVVYTINLTVEQNENYKIGICRLEKFLDGFKIN